MDNGRIAVRTLEMEPRHPVRRNPRQRLLEIREAREHSQADGDTSREEVAAMRQPTPNEVSEKTVAEIAADAEARAKRGALAVANYGKGRWIYVGLGLWRELPAGVDGAYQLLANLISPK